MSAIVVNWVIILPRYARVNTLLATVDDVIQQLTTEGWERVKYPPTLTYDEFHLPGQGQFSSLSERQFLVDLHVPCLLVFPPGTELHRHPLYRGGQLILQDKASCLPPVVLAPTPGEYVIDACSAPGMKTSQLAAMMENKGTLVAVERDRARYGTLSTMLTKAGVSNAKLVNGDFLKLRPEDHPRVTAILLDPSVLRHWEPEEAPSEERLRRLSNLQAMLLRHALSFPAVRRVVYSTCSVTEQENEQVVADTLAAHPGWRLAAAAPATWRGRARTTLPGGELCIRADPTEDLCHGFFVAAFEKVPEGEEGLNGREGKKARRKGGEKRKSADSVMEISANGEGEDPKPAMNGHVDDGAPKQKKKKRSLSKSSQGGDAGAKALVEAGAEKQPSPMAGNEKFNGAPNEAKKKRKRKQKPKKSVSESDEESTKETGGEKTLTGASLETKEPVEGNRKKKKQKKRSNQQVSNRASNGKASEVGDASVQDISFQRGREKRGISDADAKEAAHSVPAKRRKSEGTGTKVLKAGKYKKSGRLSKKRRNRLKHAAALAK
ncbi:putative 28S rRNA (cytosine-C(5))-methyltransferase [Amphibalanus amphitrite]|uniref:Putative 28S rRNA (Cytosine-C(5))-methyltransferase n=1 Tax=Amphibalanus amphitrite TaxID=1232801 RepID=A0A6A4W9D6_AMPAM|nr:putative 28S rRNA (cytosine-C(5))-methyltransferase [Amphibalanus amphitrite]